MEHGGQVSEPRTISARALLLVLVLVVVAVGGFVLYGERQSDQQVDQQVDNYLGG